jgi:hypothetical protein
VFAVDRPHLEKSMPAALERIGALDASTPFAVVGADFPDQRWERLCAGRCGGAPFREAISAVRYGSNDLAFRATLDAPAVIVVSDTLSPGWRAWADGVEQPIFRVNYLFRGLILEPGAHDVRMAYEPPGWRTSLWLAAVGLLAVAALAVAVLAQRRSAESSRLPAIVPPLVD